MCGVTHPAAGRGYCCYDSCADTWPPLTVSGEPTSGEGVSVSLGTFERDTGEMQVTAGGWPLHHFASDQNPGDAKGQGVDDSWWVLAPDGTPIRSSRDESSTSSPTEDGGGGGGGGGYGGDY